MDLEAGGAVVLRALGLSAQPGSFQGLLGFVHPPQPSVACTLNFFFFLFGCVGSSLLHAGFL